MYENCFDKQQKMLVLMYEHTNSFTMCKAFRRFMSISVLAVPSHYAWFIVRIATMSLA